MSGDGARAPVSSKLKELKSKLREIFQLDQKELDFGIYRILNQKAEEIERFLDNDLLPQVQQVLAETQQSDGADTEAELKKAIKQANELGVDPESLPKVQELRTKLKGAGSPAAIEDEVYSHLYSFFRRYYSEGDFISQRRYKEGVYAIPYEGEEVKLHWANHDQYYIKSTESLHGLAFKSKDGTKRIRFELASASTEQDNKKEQKGAERRFVLADPAWEEKNGELVVRFAYTKLDKKTKQTDLNEDAVAALKADTSLGEWSAVLFELDPTDNNKDRTAFEKHLNIFAKKHAFDYFIHKDLGTFLTRELDFYIKNEVMFLDDIEHESALKVENYLSKIKAIRVIAKKLIRMLAQLEDFQKKLWLKKKFVLETNYCITLDRVPEGLYEAIVESDAQRKEWIHLFAIDEITENRNSREGGYLEQGSLLDSDQQAFVPYSVPLTIDFLKANPFLTVDTALFDDAFKDQLLAAIDDIDDQCDGFLIHGENFQGLGLMQERYQQEIKCTYIDPPYNTGDDGFPYKDRYQHSSWLSMIDDRLRLAYPFLGPQGVLFSSINEVEKHSLEAALYNIFGDSNRVEELIWAQDTARNNSPTYSRSHEYVEVFARNLLAVEAERDMFREPKPGYAEIMDLVESINPDYPSISQIETSIKSLMNNHKIEFEAEVRDRGGDVKEEKKNDPWKGVYPYKKAEYRTELGKYCSPEEAKKKSAKIWIWREVDPSMPSGKQSATTKDPESENFRYYKPLHPESRLPCVHPKRGWSFPQKSIGDRPSFEKHHKDNRIVFRDDPNMPPQIKYFLHEVGTNVSKSVIRQYANGEQEIQALFGESNFFANLKPTGLVRKFIAQTAYDSEIVLDFFGGSGTTAHAVIDEDRSSEKSRKYILMEMGDHFDIVLKPRLQKVVYSKDWKDGKPVSREGSSHCIKYIRLESYEDALDNLVSTRDDTITKMLDDDADVREDYVLGYMLDFETRDSPSLLNTDLFSDPFNYKLRITRNDEVREQAVDLVETFNYLIGLKVAKRVRTRGVLAIEGETRSGDKILVLWRNTADITREALDDWFTKQEYNTRDSEFDVVYVNGDNNLENLRRDNETWKVRLIEQEFKTRMFDVEGL